MAARPKAAAAVAHEQGISEKLARLRAKKPVRASCWVPLSDDTAQEVNDAEQALGLARLRGEDLELLEARLRRAQEAAKADSVELIFEAVPDTLYEKLRLEHPPTEEEKKEAGPIVGQAISKDFLYALAAVSCTDDITEEELREVTADWSFGEKQHLFQVVLQANTSRRALDLDALGK